MNPADDAFGREAFAPTAQTSSRRGRPGWLRGYCVAALSSLGIYLLALPASALTPEAGSEATAAEAVSPEEKSAARDAATAGIRAFQDGDYDRALDLLRKAEDIVHAPPHLVYIARAHAAKGEFVLARETLMILINEVLPPDAPSAFRDAQAAGTALKSEIEPKIGRISIHIESADDQAVGGSIVVTVDGKVVPESILDLPYPVDPGLRKIAANGENVEGEEVAVSVAEGQSLDVTLHLTISPPLEPEPVAKAPAPVPEPPKEEPRRATSPLVFVGFGTAALGIVVGSITGGISLAQTNDAKANYCTGSACSPAGAQALDQANALANVSNVAFALAAVGVGVGLYGVISDHKQRQKPPVAQTAGPPSRGVPARVAQAPRTLPRGRVAISPQGVWADLAWSF